MYAIILGYVIWYLNFIPILKQCF